MGWVYLFAGIALSIGASILGKMADGALLSKPAIFSYVVFACDVVCWILALKTLNLASAYMIWTGVAIVGVTIAGYFVFNETFSTAKIAMMAIIFLGCMGLIYVERIGA